MFSQEIIDAIVAAANAHGWPASALLAVVECETSGKPFEQDNHTPTLLFERHKFYSELQAHQPSKLKSAIAAGLAIPKWSRKTQYKDQGTSAGRLAVIAKARQIDEEVANRAASWGLGQTMGFNAERLKYENATAMVAELSKGIAEQIDALCPRDQAPKLDRFLIAKDFAAFAKGYNGSGYKQNHYDTRMLAADARLGCADWQAATSPQAGQDHHAGLPDQAQGAELQRRQGRRRLGRSDHGRMCRVPAARRPEDHRPSERRDHRHLDTCRASPVRSRLSAPRRRPMTCVPLARRRSQRPTRAPLVTKVIVGAGALGGANQTGVLDRPRASSARPSRQGILDSVTTSPVRPRCRTGGSA
jgi:hypothetical protein